MNRLYMRGKLLTTPARAGEGLACIKHMFYNEGMESSLAKLAVMAGEMDVETADDPRMGARCARESGNDNPRKSLPIAMACMPNGKHMPLLKTLVTSACERNCNYCGCRASRDTRRVNFQPEELARLVVELTRKKVIEGLFLSSGVAGGGVRTQDRLLDTVTILRSKMNYQGYIHLKVMPGAERDQVREGMLLADRMSVNLEGPNPTRLEFLAPQKNFTDELVRPLRWIEEIRQGEPGWQGWKGHWPSITTQFVVGAAGESDLELLQTTQQLNQQVRLARGYFSRFKPTPRTPLENLPACDPWREHRLYQASFLLRDYGYIVEELPFEGAGNLPLDRDPKLALAQAEMGDKPMELNRADRQELLRIPGIGLKGADRILQTRGRNPLRTVADLRRLGIAPGRALPFILLNGRRPDYQPSLFCAA